MLYARRLSYISSFPYTCSFRSFVFLLVFFLLFFQSFFLLTDGISRQPKYSNYIINSLTRRNIVRPLATHSFHHSPQQRSLVYTLCIDVYWIHIIIIAEHGVFLLLLSSLHLLLWHIVHIIRFVVCFGNKKKTLLITNSIYRIISSLATS